MSASDGGPGTARSGDRVPRGHVLEVALLWGGAILVAQHVASGGVGLDREGRLQRGGELQLARVSAKGGVVEVPGPMRVERAGGEAVLVHDRVELAPGDVARVELGRLLLLVRILPPVPQVKGAVLGQVDLYFTRMLAFSALAAITLLVALQLTPLGSWDLVDAVGRRLPRVVRVQPQRPPVTATFAQQLAGAAAFTPKARPGRGGGPRLDVQQAGVLGALAALGAHVLGAAGPDLDSAAEGLRGGGFTAGNGLDGIGTRGVGPGGPGGGGCCAGPGKLVGIGGGDHGPLDLAGSGKSAGPRIVRGTTRVEGGLDRDAVGDVIRKHQNQVRYCYERALQADPGLAGKVSLSFVIDGTGHVSEALVAEDTLATPDVARCVQRAVQRWIFPEPRGGGQVVVTYPWIFQPAGG